MPLVTPVAADVVVGVAEVIVVIGSNISNGSKVLQMTGQDYSFPVTASCILLRNCSVRIGWTSKCVPPPAPRCPAPRH